MRPSFLSATSTSDTSAWIRSSPVRTLRWSWIIAAIVMAITSVAKTVKEVALAAGTGEQGWSSGVLGLCQGPHLQSMGAERGRSIGATL